MYLLITVSRLARTQICRDLRRSEKLQTLLSARGRTLSSNKTGGKPTGRATEWCRFRSGARLLRRQAGASSIPARSRTHPEILHAQANAEPEAQHDECDGPPPTLPLWESSN